MDITLTEPRYQRKTKHKNENNNKHVKPGNNKPSSTLIMTNFYFKIIFSKILNPK